MLEVRRTPPLFLTPMSQPVLFTFEERVGLLFTIEGATLSIGAVSVILFYALYKWARTWRNNELENSEASDSILFLSLMFADLIQGIGTMFNIKWMNDGYITEGGLCTAQAVVRPAGIVGVAMSSLAIALYTFVVLVLRNDKTIPKHIAKVVVVGIWVFVVLVIGIPSAVFRNQKYYGINGFWCLILPSYTVELIVTQYLWIWISAFFMLLLYTIMFLLMRGWIGKKGAKRSGQLDHALDTIGQPGVGEDLQLLEAARTKRVAKKMLYYPLIYIVCILPNSISRWMSFTGHPPSTKFTFSANTLFALSGLFNFFLFLITRPSWVVGERNLGERPRQTGEHGRLPPENPREGHISPSAGNGGEDDGDGFLPPG